MGQSTFESSSGIVKQVPVVMFSKIFIFAIISVTIQESFGLTTDDLLDLMEDRKGLGSPDLEEIQRLIEAKVADEIDRKMQTFRKLQQLRDRLLRRLGLAGDDFSADDDMTEADQMDRKTQTFMTFKKLQELNSLIKDRLLLRRLGLTGDDFLADDDMTEAEREAAFLLAPIGLPLAASGKFAKVGGLLTLNPLMKGTGLLTKKAGKGLIIA